MDLSVPLVFSRILTEEPQAGVWFAMEAAVIFHPGRTVVNILPPSAARREDLGAEVRREEPALTKNTLIQGFPSRHIFLHQESKKCERMSFTKNWGWFRREFTTRKPERRQRRLSGFELRIGPGSIKA